MNEDPLDFETSVTFIGLTEPDQDEHWLKADLARTIKERIAAKRLTQAKAAALMGETQPNVSAIVRGRLEAFSLDRLMHHLTALGFDVVVTLKETPPGRRQGRLALRDLSRRPAPAG